MAEKTDYPLQDTLSDMVQRAPGFPRKIVTCPVGKWSSGVDSDEVALSMSTDPDLISRLEAIPRSEQGLMIAGREFMDLVFFLREGAALTWLNLTICTEDLKFIGSEEWVDLIPFLVVEEVSAPYRIVSDTNPENGSDYERVETIDIYGFRF